MSAPATPKNKLKSKPTAKQTVEAYPSVSERLGYIRPSRELLEYYRTKISEYDNEYDDLVLKLDKYKSAYECMLKNQWEIRQREDEIRELQKALSDMQVFLFQERDHVLRLYAENDRLKLKELEDRKKIQNLLFLTAPASAETSYFVKEPPSKVTVHQHKNIAVDAKVDPHRDSKRSMNHQDDDSGVPQESLILMVEALKSQLEEQTKLCKEQVDALLEDRRVRIEEGQALHERDAARYHALSDQLHTTQNMLYDSTKDYLDLKYEFRSSERAWMAEKDILLSKLEECREKMDLDEGVDPLLGRILHTGTTSSGSELKSVSSYKQLQLQLQQTQQLADNYREQCVKMEQELCQYKEAADSSRDVFAQKSEKMSKRLDLMNKRYEALEERRRLEVEGYKTDIKLLRQRLKEVEKQLYKLTLSLTGDQDGQILSYVKQTSINSKKLMGDLQTLKAKIYLLENDTRHVYDH